MMRVFWVLLFVFFMGTHSWADSSKISLNGDLLGVVKVSEKVPLPEGVLEYNLISVEFLLTTTYCGFPYICTGSAIIVKQKSLSTEVQVLDRGQSLAFYLPKGGSLRSWAPLASLDRTLVSLRVSYEVVQNDGEKLFRKGAVNLYEQYGKAPSKEILTELVQEKLGNNISVYLGQVADKFYLAEMTW